MTSKIGYLGPEGSYCEEVAAITIRADKYLPFATISRLLQAFYKGEVEKAIIPIENSIEGIVTPSIDSLIANSGNQFVIEGEYILQVKHCLAGIGGDEEIKQIISHHQALAQCSRFVESIIVETETANSTAKAAQIVAKKREKGLAVICSTRAADIYGLEIFRKDIGDNSNNLTRFFLLGHEVQKPNGRDKTFVIFQTEDKPGALVRVLQIFDALDINIAYIQSRPSKIKLGDCIFLVETEGHQNEKDTSVALEKVMRKTSFSRVLGSYPKRNLN